MLNLVAFATFFYHAVREKECITCGCVASCVRAINAISDFAIDCSPRVVVSRAKPLEGIQNLLCPGFPLELALSPPKLLVIRTAILTPMTLLMRWLLVLGVMVTGVLVVPPALRPTPLFPAAKQFSCIHRVLRLRRRCGTRPRAKGT